MLMKNKTFFTETLIIFLMAMLVFSIPCVAASDVEAEAKRDAEKDTKSFNELKWFAGGCLGSACPYILGSACVVAGSDISLENYIPKPFIFGSEVTDFCCLSFFGAGVFLPIGYAVFHSPTPRADRFLGKSSDYVDTYTTVYRRRVKEQRVKLSAIGCMIGTSVGAFTLYYTLVSDLASRQRKSMWGE